MIRAEYKNNHMNLECSGSIRSIILELDCILHDLVENQPEIVNGCISYEGENISNSLNRCDFAKIKGVVDLLHNSIKIEEGVKN